MAGSTENKTLPILINHFQETKPIGFVECKDGKFLFSFSRELEITREMMFEVFGGAGIICTEMETLENGNRVIRSGQILEFSLCSGPAKK